MATFEDNDAIRRSTRTKFLKTIRGFDIYSHRVPTIMGTAVVLDGKYNMTAFMTVEEAVKAVVTGRGI